MLSGERMIVRQWARYWWVFLVSGLLWLLIAWVVLRGNQTSIAAVGVLIGVVFLLAGINEVGMAAVVSVMRAEQIFLRRATALLRPLGLTFARYQVLGMVRWAGPLTLGAV